MHSSSTDHRAGAASGRHPRRRSVLVVALGGVVGAVSGLALPGPGVTSALQTGMAAVDTTITVGPCDPTAWTQAVLTLAPVLEWRFDPAALRVGDVVAPGLPACDPTTVAWDLAGVVEGGLTTAAPVPLTSPEDLTVALLVDGTAGAAAEGEILEVGGAGGPVLRLVVVAGGAIELRYDDVVGDPVVLSAPAVSGRDSAYLVAVTSGPAGTTLYVDGGPVATGLPRGGVAEPLSLTVGAAPGSGRSGADLVVDEVLVLDQVLDAAAVADLAHADTW